MNQCYDLIRIDKHFLVSISIEDGDHCLRCPLWLTLCPDSPSSRFENEVFFGCISDAYFSFILNSLLVHLLVLVNLWLLDTLTILLDSSLHIAVQAVCTHLSNTVWNFVEYILRIIAILVFFVCRYCSIDIIIRNIFKTVISSFCTFLSEYKCFNLSATAFDLFLSLFKKF